MKRSYMQMLCTQRAPICHSWWRPPEKCMHMWVQVRFSSHTLHCGVRNQQNNNIRNNIVNVDCNSHIILNSRKQTAMSWVTFVLLFCCWPVFVCVIFTDEIVILLPQFVRRRTDVWYWLQTFWIGYFSSLSIILRLLISKLIITFVFVIIVKRANSPDFEWQQMGITQKQKLGLARWIREMVNTFRLICVYAQHEMGWMMPTIKLHTQSVWYMMKFLGETFVNANCRNTYLWAAF